MRKKISTRAIIMAALLGVCITSYAEKTVCHRKSNNGRPMNVVIDWNRSTVNVNGIVTRINGTVYNKTSKRTIGITTSEFTNKFNSKMIFYIGHMPGYPVAITINYANPDVVYNDGMQHNKISDYAYLSCSQSFDTPFKERMYSELESS